MSHKFSLFFLQNWKKTNFRKFAFYLAVFDPIEIQTYLAPQNDHQQLSFVKDIHVVCIKMTRNGRKKAKLIGCAFHFETELNNMCLWYDRINGIQFWYCLYRNDIFRTKYLSRGLK